MKRKNGRIKYSINFLISEHIAVIIFMFRITAHMNMLAVSYFFIIPIGLSFFLNGNVRVHYIAFEFRKYNLLYMKALCLLLCTNIY